MMGWVAGRGGDRKEKRGMWRVEAEGRREGEEKKREIQEGMGDEEGQRKKGEEREGETHAKTYQTTHPMIVARVSKLSGT